jgi:hypothetical protein
VKNFIRVATALLVIFVYGCAHPYVITPELRALDRKDVTKIDKNVGYYISAEDLVREVITPGGGGDKVQYTAYKDIEPAMQKVLSNIFTQVHTLKSPDDKQFITTNNISLVFIPKIETNSSSTGTFTWPPTDFSLTLECTAHDPGGKTVWQKKIVGDGHAEYSEFKNDFQLAARRASLKVFSELQREINSSPVFRGNK